MKTTDTSATILPAMNEAENQSSVQPQNTNEAVRDRQFLIGDAFRTASDEEA